MLLLSIVQTLDAELDRLKRLREIVAALETAPPGAVDSEGVAALLAGAEVSALPSRGEERLAPDEQERVAAVAVEERAASPLLPAAAVPAPKKRRRTSEGAERRGAMQRAEAEDGASASQEDVAPAPEDDRLLAKPASGPGAADAPKELKPSMVVVSATEAARERASRLARVPAKRAPGAHPAPKPDAAPEDLARDLAARWLSSSSSPAELSDR